MGCWVLIATVLYCTGAWADGKPAALITGTAPGEVGYPQHPVTAQWIASTAGGKPVVYANRLPGIHLDSNLWSGGGEDDRATLQGALDTLAATGGGTLVLPGCARISGSLALSSGERIIGLNEGTCGLFLSSSSNTPLLTNIHRSYMERSDSNIFVENLTVNGNGQYPQNQENQSHGDANGNFVNGIEFNGVQGIWVSNVETIDSRCFAFCFTSCTQVVAENLTGYWHFPDHNNDTVHLDAPYSYVTIHNIWGNGLDDEIALNGDENYGFAEAPNSLVDTGSADSAHVRVSEITAAGTGSAVRLISLVGKADDIVIWDLNGTVKVYGILIDTAGRPGFAGNFGQVTIGAVNLAFAGIFKEAGVPAQQMIGVLDKMDRLNLVNMTVQDYSSAYYLGWYGPWLYLGPGANIGTLWVDGNWSDSGFTAMSPTEGRIVMDGAWINQFKLGPLQWRRPEGQTKEGILMSMDAGHVGALTLFAVGTNNGGGILRQDGGEIGAINVQNLRDTQSVAPSLVISDSDTRLFDPTGAVTVGAY